MTVIFKYEPDQTIKEQFATVQSVLEKNNPVISKIDFDCGLLEQVLDPDNVLSWGYWIKHHCRCVYGEDLSHRFQAFKPSKAIAVAVNGLWNLPAGLAANLIAKKSNQIVLLIIVLCN